MGDSVVLSVWDLGETCLCRGRPVWICKGVNRVGRQAHRFFCSTHNSRSLGRKQWDRGIGRCVGTWQKGVDNLKV